MLGFVIATLATLGVQADPSCFDRWHECTEKPFSDRGACWDRCDAEIKPILAACETESRGCKLRRQAGRLAVCMTGPTSSGYLVCRSPDTVSAELVLRILELVFAGRPFDVADIGCITVSDIPDACGYIDFDLDDDVDLADWANLEAQSWERICKQRGDCEIDPGDAGEIGAAMVPAAEVTERLRAIVDKNNE